MVRTRKGRKSSGQKNTGKRGRKLFYYGVELLVIILLITAAFFIPQMIFQIQDRILCGDTVLSQRENINVEVLSATYEKSLAARMTNYAEGLAEAENYYVSSQELDINDEVSDYLYGDKGLFQELVFVLTDGGLLSPEIGDYNVTQWKQYVIYSENYAKGVNFILWYIEMENEYGERLKLLADAEDGTLYALKTEDNIRMWERFDINYEYINYWNDHSAGELWCFFMVYYEGMTEDSAGLLYDTVNNTGYTVNAILDSYPGMGELQAELDYYIENYEAAMGSVGIEVDAEGNNQLDIFDSDEITVGENAGYLIKDRGNVSYLLPFGKGHLEVLMETKELEYWEKLIDQDIYMVPDIILGIREIYELIPEFT